MSTVAILLGGLQGMRAIALDDAAPRQPANRPGEADSKVEILTDPSIRDVTPDVAAPKVPYLIDLKSRDMTPLPETITQSLATGRFDHSRFAASPDGSALAFVGEASDGTPQIFIAGIDGTGLRQITRDPTSATSPAWSPDGASVAYVGYGSGEVANLFVVDVATGESTQITSDTTYGFYEPQFTPDGSSLLYTDASDNTMFPRKRGGCCGGSAVVRTVPVAGGKSTLLLGPGKGPGDLTYWAEASMSPSTP